ncbi:response regulator transcription factor [Paenibacillus sp. 7541]|uniref:response regulator transcription factor n=1 Tax=Paenibacillus sp. 7541 TaxID=2026236 RepID=UPI000BA7708D|nr:response regulator transcription factor [Paenibacillus sp. 7541]PAK47939.1 DNA-binding response regulator [Paenibacillus sp. 7541]
MTDILIVDDDDKILELIELYLANEGYTLHTAKDGEHALSQFARHPIDLIVLDVMMPNVDGIEVCKHIRKTSNVPILMLSAKAEDMDKIHGLMTGADDYMVKPFNPLELVVRVKALLRRAYPKPVSSSEDEIVVHNVAINKKTHTVKVDGQTIKLTSLEFGILHLLASHPGRVFSSEEIFELVWKEPGPASTKTVMVHISNLREKLESAMNGLSIIHTVWGVGYKIE